MNRQLIKFNSILKKLEVDCARFLIGFEKKTFVYQIIQLNQDVFL